jgi:hypothetical protein
LRRQHAIGAKVDDDYGAAVSVWLMRDFCRDGRATRTSLYAPDVWSGRALQEECQFGWWCCGLASMYHALNVERFSPAPGHHGYEHAFDLISSNVTMDYPGNQVSSAPRRPFLHASHLPFADLGGKNIRLTDQVA